MGRFTLFLTMLIMTAGCHLRSPPPTAQKAAGPVPDNSPGIEHTDVLIYSGAGSWGDEIDSLKEILYANGKSYVDFDDEEFNELTEEELEAFSMLLIPGGDSDEVTANLLPETRDNIRKAVQEKGLNYLGFCSGAWLVVSPKPEPQEDSYGFRLVEGPWLKQTALFEKGLKYALLRASFPDGGQRNLLWFGGPITPNIPGGVVAKYPDGSPAVTQLHAGKGFVMISGLHPAVNKKILGKIKVFDKEAIDPDLSWKMLDSAIRGVPLPAFAE